MNGTQGGGCRNLIYGQLVRSPGNNLELLLVSEVQGGDGWDVQSVASQSDWCQGGRGDTVLWD